MNPDTGVIHEIEDGEDASGRIAERIVPYARLSLETRIAGETAEEKLERAAANAERAAMAGQVVPNDWPRVRVGEEVSFKGFRFRVELIAVEDNRLVLRPLGRDRGSRGSRRRKKGRRR